MEHTSDLPGVTIERREFLRFAAGCSLLPSGLAQARSGFERFTTDWRKLAASLRASELTEDSYVFRLAAAVASVGDIPPMQRTVFEGGGLRTGPAWFGGDVFAVVLRMDPGATIPLHRHRSHNVVTIGLRGECRYRHYEPLAELPDPADRSTTFRLRRRRSGLLRPGRWSELTQTRDNMHWFEAGPDGATIVDLITTVEKLSGSTTYIEVEERPVDSFARVHDARWSDLELK